MEGGIPLGQWFLKLKHATESPGGLLKKQIARPNPKVSSCGLRIWISTKFPGDVNVAGLENYTLRAMLYVN